MHLVLIRHGQTAANLERRLVGTGSTPLTDLGRLQAELTARRLAAETLDAVAVYSSPLARALYTATAIGRALDLVPIPIAGLREIDFGELDGFTVEEMAARRPQLFARWQDRTDSRFTWPGGERRSDFFRRVGSACDAIRSRHHEGTVSVVAHDGTLRACLAHLLPAQFSEHWTYALDNCGITRLALETESARLVVLNDTTHLAALRGDVSPDSESLLS